MSYEFVATIGELPEGRGLRVDLAGIDVGIFRAGSEIFAMENRCPHAGDPLSEGCLVGKIVSCRAHGWEFDVSTGFRPDNPDGFPIPCFPVRIDGDRVLVDIDAPLNLGPKR
jgi:3-phenylpropionate/trans-cinnamate dioxygenase ferredoxin subunit